MRTVEAIAAGTLNITFIIELRFKIIKIVARRFAKKLNKKKLRKGIEGLKRKRDARNEEVN